MITALSHVAYRGTLNYFIEITKEAFRSNHRLTGINAIVFQQRMLNVIDIWFIKSSSVYSPTGS